MPTPPVTNPTPFTCLNCGAGLTECAEFCSRCGASLRPVAIKSAGWNLSATVAGFGALIFGGIGACSAGVTVSTFTHPSFELGKDPLFISIPFFFVSLTGICCCTHALWRRLRK